MTTLNWIPEIRLRTTVGSDFKVVQGQNEIIFKNQKIKDDDYFLNCELLSESEILEIGKILFEVYRSVPQDPYLGTSSDRLLQNLNDDSQSSHKFLRAVLRLSGSSFHKFLLLTSGAKVLESCSLDTAITLAKVKDKANFSLDDAMNSRFYFFLKERYIFPGITPFCFDRMSEKNLSTRITIEHASSLLAFLSNDFEDLILSDHLELDFAKAIATQNSVKEVGRVNDIHRILRSGYKDLALSMTAKELNSLCHILRNDAPNGHFSESILKSRSKAMEPNVAPLDNYGSDSIFWHLSRKERESLSSFEVIETLNELVASRDIKAQTQPIVYTALAEVLSVKGEKKALEVAQTLEHLRFSRDRNLKMYEATVAIIEEALKPESDEFPFAWSAQLSEHAWVLSSHIKAKQKLPEML